MTLALADIHPRCALTSSTDAYVPLKIELGGGPDSIDELFYWRAVGDRSLLEIRLVARTGMLSAVSVVLVPRKWTRFVASVVADEALPSSEGVPMFNLDAWKSKLGGRQHVDPSLRFIDEACHFCLELGEDGLAIRFEGSQARSVVANGDVNFLFAKDKSFCGLTLTRTTAEQLASLRKFHGP